MKTATATCGDTMPLDFERNMVYGGAVAAEG
jgi:hypothetical protein